MLVLMLQLYSVRCARQAECLNSQRSDPSKANAPLHGARLDQRMRSYYKSHMLRFCVHRRCLHAAEEHEVANARNRTSSLEHLLAYVQAGPHRQVVKRKRPVLERAVG